MTRGAYPFIKRMLAVTAAAMLAVALTGCQMSAYDSENLMRPPAATGDGANILQAMEEYLGTQISFRYPRNGEYRSAVVRADIDADGIEEAVIFCRAATDSTGARMVLLDTDSRDNWTVVGEWSGNGGEIDRVMFGDIDGDGNIEIIAGWTTYAGHGLLSAHRYKDKLLQAIPILDSQTYQHTRSASSYTVMAIGDFCADGTDTILTVDINRAESTCAARLLKYIKEEHSPRSDITNGGLRVIGEADLTASASNYISALAGCISEGQFGLVLDRLDNDGYYYTEAVCWNDGLNMLTAPLKEKYKDEFKRSCRTPSRDIDGDGYIEFPSDKLLPGCEEEGAVPVYITQWKSFSIEGKPRQKLSAIMREDDGYYYIVPNSLEGKITAQPEPQQDTLIFYSVENDIRSEIMRIRVFPLDEWSGYDQPFEYPNKPGYIQLSTTTNYVYAVMITDSGSPPLVTYEMVAEGFVND